MSTEEYIMLYAIIPKYIYTTKSLSSEEKLIAERITALCRKNGYAWVSNKCLANMYGIREDTVSKHIKKLKEIDFIKCKYGKDTDGKSTRVIYLTNNVWDKQPYINCSNMQDSIGSLSVHNNKYEYKNNSKLNNIISYDVDGVMLWNGKRCESKQCTEDEFKEMQSLLSEYRGDSIE